jgi:hypothetical protein
VAFGEGSNFIDYLIENLPSIVKTIKDIGTASTTSSSAPCYTPITYSSRSSTP